MNKYQRAYIISLTQTAALRAEHDKIEKDYIQANNIKNEDGSEINHLWEIEDYDKFDQAMAAVEGKLNSLEVWKYELHLRKAEDRLIEYALSILPSRHEKERDTLRISALEHRNFKVRQKIIDYALTLDTQAVPTKINIFNIAKSY